MSGVTLPHCLDWDTSGGTGESPWTVGEGGNEL